MKKLQTKIQPKEIEISGLIGESLAYIIKQLKENGVKEKDYDKVIIDADYGGCFYEGDIPSIHAVYKEKK